MPASSANRGDAGSSWTNEAAERGGGPTLRFFMEFLRLISQWGCCVGHQSRYLELFSDPPFVVAAVASCSSSWAVNGEASSLEAPGSL